MLKNLVLYSAVLLTVACNNASNDTAAPATEGDVDAARTFVRSALDGKWKEAQSLIIPDSANKEWLATAERSYLHDSVTVQRRLRESTIRIHNTQKLNDSVSLVTYSNTFRNQKQTIKTVRQGGSWLVDLKYTFQNADSTRK